MTSRRQASLGLVCGALAGAFIGVLQDAQDWGPYLLVSVFVVTLVVVGALAFHVDWRRPARPGRRR